MYACLGFDPLVDFFRFDYWMAPIDSLMKAELGVPMDSRRDEGIRHRMVHEVPFSSQPTRFGKVFGADLPKLQLFRGVEVLENDLALSKTYQNSDFMGGQLLTTRESMEAFLGLRRAVADGAVPSGIRHEVSGKNRIGEDRHAAGEVRVTSFGGNGLTCKASLCGPDGGWLYYADVWHPRWKAYVNGAEVPVLKADLAFKAVPIPPGDSEVKFVFRDPVLNAVLSGVGVALGAGVCGILWCVFRLFRADMVAAPDPRTR